MSNHAAYTQYFINCSIKQQFYAEVLLLLIQYHLNVYKGYYDCIVIFYNNSIAKFSLLIFF